ncbi:MAG: SDR family oxidoreductase, partial [Flammeovirgaceae bacterium]
MNYLITGSIGHISKPIVQRLVAEGHHVSVVTSSADRAKDIEALKAKSLIGSVEDAAFVSRALAGVDAVYLMVPPNWALQGEWIDYQKAVVHNYVNSIVQNGVKNVVLLSSIGAHMRKGAGPVDGLSYAEIELEALKDVNVKIFRPSYFFYNLFSMIPLLKNMNIVGSNFGNTDEKLVLVHTSDIADVIGNALAKLDFTGYSIQYIASDERHPNEIAKVITKAAGKPAPWVTFTDEQSLQGMLQAQLPSTIANGYVELGAGIRNGAVQADYWKNRPVLGKIKLEDFAKE